VLRQKDGAILVVPQLRPYAQTRGHILLSRQVGVPFIFVVFPEQG